MSSWTDLQKQRISLWKKEVKYDPSGYRYFTNMLKTMPNEMKHQILNRMNPGELYCYLLLDNPKIGFVKIFYNYLLYLRDNIETVQKIPGGLDKIVIFGLDSDKSWQQINCREHLVDISAENNLFWDYCIHNCPFVITLLIAIENDDVESLSKFINLYNCVLTSSRLTIFEMLVNYAYDFRRLNLIDVIIREFGSVVLNPDTTEMNDIMGRLMHYFTENQLWVSLNNIVAESADFIKLVDILEANFGDRLYQFFQIDWSGYVYYLVKHDMLDKLIHIGSQLVNDQYMALDYEIVVYALHQNMDHLLAVLLTAFQWNDRRSDANKARLSDLPKAELEKMVWYLLQNMYNQNTNIEKGFDPSFAGHMKMTKKSQASIGEIYGIHSKRFHMNVYLKSSLARQLVMEDWCQKSGTTQNLVESLDLDSQDKKNFHRNVGRYLRHKLNRTLAQIDKYHVPKKSLFQLVEEFIEYSEMIYQNC